MAADSAVAVAGSQGKLDSLRLRTLVINNFASARILRATPPRNAALLHSK